MERTKVSAIFTKKSEFCEKVSKKPVSTFVPNQAISLKELVQRFERGQRLNIHENFAPMSNFYHATDEESQAQMKAEDAMIDAICDNDIPTGGDIVDVQDAMRAHEERKRAYSTLLKQKKEKAKQAQHQKQAQQAAEVPPDPAA